MKTNDSKGESSGNVAWGIFMAICLVALVIVNRATYSPIKVVRVGEYLVTPSPCFKSLGGQIIDPKSVRWAATDDPAKAGWYQSRVDEYKYVSLRPERELPVMAIGNGYAIVMFPDGLKEIPVRPRSIVIERQVPDFAERLALESGKSLCGYSVYRWRPGRAPEDGKLVTYKDEKPWI